MVNSRDVIPFLLDTQPLFGGPGHGQRALAAESVVVCPVPHTPPDYFAIDAPVSPTPLQYVRYTRDRLSVHTHGRRFTFPVMAADDVAITEALAALRETVN